MFGETFTHVSLVKGQVLGKPLKTACFTGLLYLSQKSVDSFDKGCIMTRVEGGADAQTSVGRKTSHLRLDT